MPRKLLNRILPVLLSLALLLALAPPSALSADAATPPKPEKTAAQDQVDSVSKSEPPLRRQSVKGDRSDDWDIDEIDAIDLALDKELELSFADGQDELWLRYTPELRSLFCLSSSGNLDVYVTLFDENGNYINSDDDSGYDFNFRLRSILNAGAVYYFRIWHYESESSETFSVLLSAEDFAPIEIEPDRELSLILAEGQYEVWLHFEAPETAFYTLSSMGDVDAFAELRDEYGALLASDDDSGEGNNFSLTYSFEAKQNCYYQLKHYSDSNAQVKFSVLLTEYVPVTSGECGARGDNLLWSFDLETGVLTIEGSGDMEDYSFGEAPWYPLGAYLTELRLPDGMSSIGSCAFYDCWNLSEVTVPETVERIGNYAFCWCNSLSSVTLPGHMSCLGSGAFADCSKLSSVTLPEGLTAIEDDTFCWCSALSSAVIPEGVTRIGNSAFLGCYDLESVSIPEGVTGIGDDAFNSCWSLTRVNLPDSLTELGASAFRYCSGLVFMSIPAGVRSIEDYTFNLCSGLITVTLPAGVRSIGEYAFGSCSSLISVNLPAGISRIGTGAFDGCRKLDMLVIRNADCLAGFVRENYDPDDTEEDLEGPWSDETLGGHKTVIYGRHDQDKLDSGDIEECYLYAEAYALNYGYTFYDLYAFSDVREYSWYEIPVAWACGNGITAGTGERTFSPGNTCTREQTVTFLWKAAGSPEPVTTENPFRDVKTSKYYYRAVLWALENGITAGVDTDLFGVGQSCTREQVVTFLWKTAGSPEPLSSENPFRDVKENKYYYKAILWAVENGITAGVDVDLFGVGMSCTRAQIVTFLYVSRDIMAGTYSRADDDEVCEAVFGEFEALMEQSRNAETNDERFVLEARAEAALLDTGAMIPMSSNGGSFALSRVAPHTGSFAQWGSDSDRLHGLVISDEFLTPAERSDLEAQWEAAVAGTGTYDPAAYLTGKGHRLANSLNATFSVAPVTLDWLNTCSGSDTRVLVNCVDGLVEYDNLGNLQPALAESWEISDDGLSYTFHIRQGVKWYTAAGDEYAELTANDFVAGFRHMLDCGAGLESLAGRGGAEIEGVEEYLWDGGSFADVGCRATDDYTLVYRLNEPVPYFMTMLSYSIFLPLCDSFYQAHGGVYGVEEFQEAVEGGSYTFAQAEDLNSQVYCGPYLLRQLQAEDEILCVKNPNYYKADEVTLNSIRWFWSYNYASDELYNETVSGIFAEIALAESSGTLDLAISDGNFDRYAYVTETGATTFFGGLNLNRGTFELEDGACASPKSEREKADAFTAFNNRNFRKALQHAFDKSAYNAVSRGWTLAEANLRNIYTAPDLVKLENDFTDAEGHSFAAGTLYGELVQYYCDQRGCQVDCADGQDGWYKPEAAQDYLAAAKAELGASVSWPIQIDVVYYAYSDIQTAQAFAYRESIEDVLGSENVVVNLIPAESSVDYYACSYLTSCGAEINCDMSFGNGWAPDCGDPATYLNSFDRRVDGIMLKYLGLY